MTRLAGPVIEATAGGALSGHRAVVSLAGVVIHAQPQTPGHCGLVAGITRGAVSNGFPATVQVYGPMCEPTWNWTADLPLFVGTDGVLTQTYPATGWVQQVAVARSATEIFIDVQPPAEREETLSLPFAWGDATPAAIGTMPPGLVTRVELVIETPFDGSGPSLRVGRSGALEELLAAAQVDPAAAGIYETSPGVRYASATPLLLSIVPGAAAAAGNGLVVITFQR